MHIDHTRLQAAQATINELTARVIALRQQMYAAAPHSRADLSAQIANTERQIARAMDEKRRARAGAPPATADYAPQRYTKGRAA